MSFGAPRRARRRRSGRAAALGIACALAAGCGTEGDGPAAPEPPSAARAEPEREAEGGEAPTRASGPDAPARGGPEDEPPPFPCTGGGVEAGAPLYQEHCASCHGPEGDGEGPAAAALNPKPVHLDNGAYMNRLSNEYLRRIIAEGGAAVGKSSMMPGLASTLGPDAIRDVVAFVRSLAEPSYRCPAESPEPTPGEESPSEATPGGASEGDGPPAARTPEARKSGRPPG